MLDLQEKKEWPSKEGKLGDDLATTTTTTKSAND